MLLCDSPRLACRVSHHLFQRCDLALWHVQQDGTAGSYQGQRWERLSHLTIKRQPEQPQSALIPIQEISCAISGGAFSRQVDRRGAEGKSPAAAPNSAAPPPQP